MAVPPARRISAASARAHTRRKHNQSSFSLCSPGVCTSFFVVLLAGMFVWVYPSFVPSPPKICGSLNGPPVMAPRIQLKDGRHLAYKEHGVPKEIAKYKFVFIHGFSGNRHTVPTISSELAEDLGIYLLSFDRPGYGESDPDPKRTEKTIALDIEELADKMELGPTFYVVGYSMGGQAVWGCLKYIPQRLAGSMLIAPVVNYWWSSFPPNLSKEAYNQQLLQDQWTLRIAHHVPWLTYWWNTQKWFPSSSLISPKPERFSPPDRAIRSKQAMNSEQVIQASINQSVFESLHRDMMVGFGKWSFDPMHMDNPFTNKEGSVHLWQGDDDTLVPVILQRYIAKKLPWIQYHELPGAGHLFASADGMFDTMVKALLTGQVGMELEG